MTAGGAAGGPLRMIWAELGLECQIGAFIVMRARGLAWAGAR